MFYYMVFSKKTKVNIIFPNETGINNQDYSGIITQLNVGVTQLVTKRVLINGNSIDSETQKMINERLKRISTELIDLLKYTMPKIE